MRRDPNLATRRVHFYRADLRFDDVGAQIPMTAAHFAPLELLSFDDGSAYQEDDNRVSCGWLDDRAMPVRIRIADIRRADLPFVESRGALAPLAIDPDSGLAEATHAAFYENNIVGVEFNFYGPRAARCASFLRAKSPALGRLTLLPLLRRDVVRQLDRLRDIRLFHVRVLPAYVDSIAREDASLAEALRGLSALGDVGRAEVILKPIPYSRHPLGQRLRAILRALAGRDDILEGADVLKTAGFNADLGRVEEIDLLRDEFVAERQVPRAPAPARGVETPAMYAAIDNAYRELRPELEQAAGVDAQ